LGNYITEHSDYFPDEVDETNKTDKSIVVPPPFPVYGTIFIL
jgi:hypothetical protein